MRQGAIVVVLGLGLAVLGSFGGCNQQGACPGKAKIQPGAPCNDDLLQCAYDLTTPSNACDGTTQVIPTSCSCTQGAWACPTASTCGSGDGGSDATSDAGGGDDGSADAPADSISGDSAPLDSAPADSGPADSGAG